MIRFDGSNGAEIVAALADIRRARNDQLEQRMEVSPTYQGHALSVDVVYPDGQRSPDRWRVPVGYWINPNNGEVTDEDGVPQDYETLLQVS